MRNISSSHRDRLDFYTVFHEFSFGQEPIFVILACFHFMRTETSRLQSPLQPVTDDSVLALLFSPPHDVLRLVLVLSSGNVQEHDFQKGAVKS